MSHWQEASPLSAIIIPSDEKPPRQNYKMDAGGNGPRRRHRLSGRVRFSQFEGIHHPFEDSDPTKEVLNQDQGALV